MKTTGTERSTKSRELRKSMGLVMLSTPGIFVTPAQKKLIQTDIAISIAKHTKTED